MTPEQLVLKDFGVLEHTADFRRGSLDPATWTDAEVYALVCAGVDLPVEELLWSLKELSPAVARIVDAELRWMTPEACHNAVALLCGVVPEAALLDALRGQYPPALVAGRMYDRVASKS